MRATAVATLGALSCGVALAAIQLTQSIPLDIAFFEVVSALATVGLSTGGTGALDEVGKVIIIACMFAGRVGPVTLFVFLASNTRAHRAHRYAEEPVAIG
jgi:trk system potassium uptake protein TrkH